MNDAEATLQERTGGMYRRLLLLQCLFAPTRDADDSSWLASGDQAKDAALCAAIREIVDELTAQALALTSVPFPLSEWRPGDSPDDNRWGGLTELERRDLLSMISGYERLLSWGRGVHPESLGRQRKPAGAAPRPQRLGRWTGCVGRRGRNVGIPEDRAHQDDPFQARHGLSRQAKGRPAKLNPATGNPSAANRNWRNFVRRVWLSSDRPDGLCGEKRGLPQSAPLLPAARVPLSLVRGAARTSPAESAVRSRPSTP